MLIQRTFYTLLLWLLLPYVFLRLLWRARKQPEYLHHIGERFGFYTLPACQPENPPVIWLHAVSVGETRAAQTLIDRLRQAYPHHQIVLTHTTPTGRTTSVQGDNVLRVYLPYDYPFAVNKFLRRFKPQFGILMETEIWFNLIHICHTSGVPLLLLNARLSEKSARKYARFARLTQGALAELAAVAAQTAEDAARLASLGATNVSVTGNLKFDIEPPSVMLELGKQFREQFGANGHDNNFTSDHKIRHARFPHPNLPPPAGEGTNESLREIHVKRRVFLAASTREGEEALLLDALKEARIPELLLVIVPRHPQRFAEVAGLLEQRGFAFQRRSELGQTGVPQTVPPEIQAVLGDSMGELFAYYAAADIAFVGGSLLPYGGQNMIEACAAGVPVLVGQYTYNFAEATRLAVAAGAAVQVLDSGSLIGEVQRLLADPAALDEMHNRCAGFVNANRGATEKSLQIILSLGINPDSAVPGL